MATWARRCASAACWAERVQTAPLYEDVADAPPGGTARWRQTDDGRRIRVAFWPPAPKAAPRGTVLLFTGRTEYIEKYGPAARHFTTEAYAFLTLDWRGQGLSERALADPSLGHVDDFSEYQRDIAAALAVAQEAGLPRPYFLVGHSMGGCIGLRALHEGLDVGAAVFSAPMWGIHMTALQRPVAWVGSHLAALPALGRCRTPGTSDTHTLRREPFEGNDLTTDREMWDFMQTQIERHPDLHLGGPTLRWLRAALAETRALAALPPPDVPAITFLGDHDRIVAGEPIRRIMGRWRRGRLEMVAGAEHEIMMERPEVRGQFYRAATARFSGAG